MPRTSLCLSATLLIVALLTACSISNIVPSPTFAIPTGSSSATISPTITLSPALPPTPTAPSARPSPGITVPLPTATSPLPTLTIPPTLQPTLGRSTPTRTSTPRATGGKHLEPVGAVGGRWPSALALDGNYAYVTSGPSFVVLDVSRADQPRVAGQSTLLPGPVIGITLSSGYAYVSAGEAGVYVFNVARPQQPTLVGTLPVQAWQIVFAGGYAYTVGGEAAQGLKIWRVDDPSHWSLVGSAGSWSYRHVAVAGSYAYTVSDGLYVFDVTDPRHPSQVGFYGPLPYVTGIALAGRNVLVSVEDISRGHMPTGGVHIVDVSQPAQPRAVNVYQVNASVYGVSVGGDFVYFAAAGKLQTLNLSDPAHLVEVSSYDFSGLVTDMQVAGTKLYIAGSYGDSLSIVDISRPERPLSIGSYVTPRSSQQVALSGHYAFVADFGRGLVVVDVSDPRAPVPVATTQPFYASGVSIQGNYAYVAAYDLHVINIADPLHPVEVGALPIPARADKVIASGRRAYLGAGLTFVVVDISNPAAPRELSQLISPDTYALDIQIAGSYAVVAGGSKLRVIDVADPARPREVADLPISGWASSVRMLGNYAYVAADDWVRVVNMANPLKPSLVASYPTQNALYLGAADNTVYAAEGADGLRALNVTDPTKPVEITQQRIMQGVGRITAGDGYIYVTEMNGGLVILQWREN